MADISDAEIESVRTVFFRIDAGRAATGAMVAVEFIEKSDQDGELIMHVTDFGLIGYLSTPVSVIDGLENTAKLEAFAATKGLSAGEFQRRRDRMFVEVLGL